MHLKNTGRLGGRDLSWNRRIPLMKKHIWPKQPMTLSWKAQCWCGSMEYVHWRKRYYCYHCGAWVRNWPEWMNIQIPSNQAQEA